MLGLKLLSDFPGRFRMNYVIDANLRACVSERSDNGFMVTSPPLPGIEMSVYY